MRSILLACLLVFTASPVLAIDTERAFDDPAQQARYEKLARELRCVTCRSQSIADSNVELAADLRRQIRELMRSGKSDQEIMQYMTDRYGDYVLYKPPLAARTVLLWAAPVLLVLGGAVAAIVVIRRKAKLPEDDPADPGLGVS